MRTRTIREGSAGLLILLGVAVFGGLGLWLRGFNPANRSYKIVVEFGNARGIQDGTAVRYRGVTVGKISRVRPGPNNVDAEIQISPADLVIPRDVLIEANRSGLIGETFIDITPRNPLPAGSVAALPLDPKCNPSLIVCNGARLEGQAGGSVDELIRTTTRLARLLDDAEFFNNIKLATKNTADAASGFAQLSREFTVLTRAFQQEIKPLSTSAQVAALSLSQTADRFGVTADQLNGLIAANRVSLVTTLDNLSQTSTQLRLILSEVTPMANRLQQSELLANLEKLTANAAQASANLRDVSSALNSPTNVLVLQQTLDSARVTFQNVQKITSDLDELTGDPAFRNNLRNLINGLSGLVSSTQQLEEQTQMAQVLPVLLAQAQNQPKSTREKPALGSQKIPASELLSVKELHRFKLLAPATPIAPVAPMTPAVQPREAAKTQALQ